MSSKSRTQIRKLNDAELSTSFELMKELRTHLSKEDFLNRVKEQSANGYELMGAFIDSKLVGLLGMRPVLTLARGPHFHIDDLVVSSSYRRIGIGRELLCFAEQVALTRGFRSIFLDSRREVLGFYEREGFIAHTAVLMKKALS